MDKFKSLERILKVLANRRRLKILKYLKDHPVASVSEIADAIDLSIQSTSKHLTILKSIQAVRTKQSSLLVYYYLAESLDEPGGYILSIL
ncbi:MAG: helix-turn-helix domain-containing protein [Patescibacteria group bacterium]|nr:helix-turn-helix domain-containing protein [Patescibacteria group bacterium]